MPGLIIPYKDNQKNHAKDYLNGTKFPQDKVYESEVLGRTVTTYGDVFTELLRGRFNAEELPYFAIVDPEANTLRQFSGETRDVAAFVCFLRGCE